MERDFATQPWTGEEIAAAERETQERLRHIHDICDEFTPTCGWGCRRCGYAASDHIPGVAQDFSNH